MPIGSKMRLTVLKIALLLLAPASPCDRLDARSARWRPARRSALWICWLSLIDDLLLRVGVGFEDADVHFGADEALGQVLQRRPERVVEDRPAQDPVVLDQPGIVDLVRRGHVVGDQDHRRELVDAAR